MSIHDKARALRANSTDTERRLWFLLRSRRLQGAKFRRQHPIGPYIADFACIERRVIIELDGGQHQEQSRDDQARDSFLHSRGFVVLRFWNNEVLTETDNVLEKIFRAIRAAASE